SDYLRLMLEFLYAAEWQGDERAEESLTLLIMVLEDGTYHMIQAWERNKSPSFNLIKGIRETFKACVDESMKESEQTACAIRDGNYSLSMYRYFYRRSYLAL